MDMKFKMVKRLLIHLRSFFKITFDNSKINPPFTGYFQLNSDLVSFNEISKDDIIESINKLKSKKSLGPDNVPSYIYFQDERKS